MYISSKNIYICAKIEGNGDFFKMLIKRSSENNAALQHYAIQYGGHSLDKAV